MVTAEYCWDISTTRFISACADIVRLPIRLLEVVCLYHIQYRPDELKYDFAVLLLNHELVISQKT